MIDEPLREVYSRIMRERDATGRAGAVSVEEMRAVIERRGPESERVRTLDAIMRDQDTRADFEILRAAYEAAPPRPQFARAPYAIAAALVVMVGGGLWVQSRTPPTDVVRGPAPTLSVVAPGSTVPADVPLRFTWRPVATAKGYSLQVVDQDGNVAYATITADTTAALPASVKLVPDAEYQWWVEAERSSGAPVKSAVQPLRVTAR